MNRRIFFTIVMVIIVGLVVLANSSCTTERNTCSSLGNDYINQTAHDLNIKSITN